MGCPLDNNTNEGKNFNQETHFTFGNSSKKITQPFFFILFQNHTRKLDFDYFVSLFEEYYLSDDPSCLGNFINGKLDYEADDSENEDLDFETDPGLLDHRRTSSTSVHSMDDDLSDPDGSKARMKAKKAEEAKARKIRELEQLERDDNKANAMTVQEKLEVYWDDIKSNCFCSLS